MDRVLVSLKKVYCTDMKERDEFQIHGVPRWNIDCEAELE